MGVSRARAAARAEPRMITRVASTCRSAVGLTPLDPMVKTVCRQDPEFPDWLTHGGHTRPDVP